MSKDKFKLSPGDREYLTYAGDVVANDDTEALIEARNPDSDWDSDYVGNNTITIAAAMEFVAVLRDDLVWEGWEFRVLPMVNDSYDAKNEIYSSRRTK